VPAVFGLGGAMEHLPAGAVVTVDADGLRVIAGAVPALVTRPETRRGALADTPVHATLAQVTHHIVPLTLFDPDAPTFKAAACQTLHDITRFCHEHSVREMFSFGRDHAFAERSSKRLVTDVVTQLWVLNLDDGFHTEVDGPTVSVENIACAPMLAVWEGMQAVPWQGPPPIDARGFMAVMFQATANPALDPAMAGGLHERNYFMISRNFCSLQSRFGFHFATVEALVSERTSENYLRFQFAGGAADIERRSKRVLLVAELLAPAGLRVETRQDSLSSRLDALPEDEMLVRLRVLGYLLTHTRQLDMVMNNPAQMQHAREKMAAEIARLLAGELRPQKPVAR
jgi:pyruvate,water dikinase